MENHFVRGYKETVSSIKPLDPAQTINQHFLNSSVTVSGKIFRIFVDLICLKKTLYA